MRRFALPVSVPRLAAGLAIPAALAVVVGGAAFIAPAAASAAVTARAAAPACTVHWVGKAVLPDWTNPKNWSTGQVPGPTSDVCIGTGVDVLTDISITVHSLNLGPFAGIAMEGTSSNPLTMTVTTSITLTPGGASRMDLTDTTVNAAQISNQGGTIFTDGTVSLVSPDIVFGAGGSLQAANGPTSLTSLANLAGGTLTGASFSTSGATVVLPGDITHLVSSNVGVGAVSGIQDANGHNALTGLTSVDANSSLTADSALSLTGGLIANGNVSVQNQGLTVHGAYTQAQGTLQLFQTKLTASQVTIDQPAFLNAYVGPDTIAGNLVNDGTVFTGGSAHVTGSYTQAPGANLGAGFSGTLKVAGLATLAGTLSPDDIFPIPGTTSPAVTFGSRSGDFTSVGLGFTLLTTATAVDAVATPQIAASPATVAPGGTVTVTSASFKFQSSVKIFLDRVGGKLLATTEAGYRGRFSVSGTIPLTTKAGGHTLIAVGSDGSQASVPITVS
jgi:hypothetical protein